MTSTPDGPVEWVAITFLGTTLGAGVAAPLAELIDAKTVRLLDAAVVHKAADGIVTEGELAGTASAVAGKVAAAQEAGAAQDRTRMQTEVETQVADALRAEAAAPRGAVRRRPVHPAHQARRAAGGGPAHRRGVRRAEDAAARMTAGPRRRIAIACQGGGSHTAFTAGVLRRLLDGPEIDEYDVVGLSGTSGGAVCALLAWTALREGDRHRARALLDAFWADNAASTPLDVAANVWLMWASHPAEHRDGCRR